MKIRLFTLCLLIVACDGSPPQKKKTAPDASVMMPSCTPGTLACGCDSTGGCSDPTAFCNSDRQCAQVKDGCTPGTLECTCAGGGCNSGLSCMDGVCRDNTGFAGGPCLADNHCHTGNRCSDGVCVQCVPGSQGCTCSAGGCDETLACEDGMCVTGQGYAAAAPSTADTGCLTPCSGPLVAPDGTVVACPSDGVMAGCLPGLACMGGQCVCPGASPRPCTADVDCPDFNTCLRGSCRGNCNSSTECVAGAVCFRHVCRKSCDISKPDCQSGLFCQPADGQSGVCAMRADPAAPDLTSPAPAVTLSSTLLRFSPSSTTSQLTIQNGGGVDAHVVVRKLRQREPNLASSMPVTIELDAREVPPAVTTGACTPGTQGCKCSSDTARPCVSLSSSFSLKCESDICQLPSCQAGTEGCVCQNGDCRLLCDAGRCPLSFVSTSVDVGGQKVISAAPDVVVDFVLPAAQSATLTVSAAAQIGAWDGALEVESLGAGSTRQEVLLSYADTPDGRWTGNMAYFGDFLVDAAALDRWRADRGTITSDGSFDTEVHAIHNAFLENWAQLRRGNIGYRTFLAILDSTRTESWRSPDLVQKCPQGNICYPTDTTTGYEVYTYSPNESPIPAGVVQMPFAMMLAAGSDATRLAGAVDSTSALQYPGSPAVDLAFAADPATCKPSSDGTCITFLDHFAMTSIVGGRYRGASSCAAGYRDFMIPWLVPGFAGDSAVDAASGLSYVHECRESVAPLPGTSDDIALHNGDLAGANPIFDGQERPRSLEVIDGALVNGSTMIILFRESTPPLVNDPTSPSAAQSGTAAYGFIVLKRSTPPDGAVAPSTSPVHATPPASATPATSCSADLMQSIANKLLVTSADLTTPAHVNDFVTVLLTGNTSAAAGTMSDANSWSANGEQVHYVCGDTRQFDTQASCGADSPVSFFTVDPSALSAAAVLGDPCQSTKTCDATLQKWINSGMVTQAQPSWKCADPTVPTCDDANDRRKGKVFFARSSGALFLPLDSAVQDAFRYRTRFQSRSGKNLGFAPDICGTDAQPLPYCYSPDAILALEKRFDCLGDLFIHHYTDLSDTSVKTALTDALRTQLSDRTYHDSAANTDTTYPGFEWLRAELLVMLGDDAYTQALSSRFDLAELSGAAFEGTLFEPGGINLSGIAGAEMRNLYLATEYYQLAFDRLVRLLPSLERMIDRNGSIPQPVVNQATVVDFLTRVLRASSQKARVAGEIGKRYQNLDMATLARHVIERSYVSGYLESMVMTSLMRTIAAVAGSANVPQIRSSIQDAQRVYRVGLADMVEQYRGITDSVNYFGLPADYIPFPEIEPAAARDSAFDVAINRAHDRVALAKDAEDTALATTRSFDSDAVSFQNELVSVSNTYESQLIDLCGSFVSGGSTYPAISRYAYLDPKARSYGDPCGLLGTGEIAQATLDVAGQEKELELIQQQMRNTVDEAAIQQQRVNDSCKVQFQWKDATIQLQDQSLAVQSIINGLQLAEQGIDKARQTVIDLVEANKCSIADCVELPADDTAVVAADAAFTIGGVILQAIINGAQLQEQTLQNQQADLQFDFQCDLAEVDAKAQIKTILLRMSELQIEAERGLITLQQAIGKVQQLRNQAVRVAAQEDESFQLTINQEAARNDPNVRIYRDDSVIHADNTFQDALREAFEATRVFEYYTSQSYPDKDKLFLSRMIARGDYNLSEYVTTLENAFHAFEDDEGTPDLRVLVLSLRDDLLSSQVPYLTTCGAPISTNDRVKLMQKQLADPSLRDANGYIVVPFRIGPELTSPLTRDHKLRWVEAQIIGGNGDQVGRVYLRMSGASSVYALDDERQYFSFPKRTGVINVFFSVKPPEYDPNVFRTNRFADRPLMNSRWELVLNMKDEPANLDFTLGDISDVRLYFYYSDFTKY